MQANLTPQDRMQRIMSLQRELSTLLVRTPTEAAASTHIGNALESLVLAERATKAALSATRNDTAGG